MKISENLFVIHISLRKRFVILLSIVLPLSTGCSSIVESADECGIVDFRSTHSHVFSTIEKHSINLAEEMSLQNEASNNPGKAGLLPFPRRRLEWESLKKDFRDGDCLIYFKSPPETWIKLRGRKGYMHLRDGEVINTISTGVS